MKKLLVALLSVSLLLVGCSNTAETVLPADNALATENPPPVLNAQSAFNCNVRQGFNFEKDAQVLAGHVNYLKIGDQVVNADLNVTNPEDVSKLVKVLGILSNISWAGGGTDPIIFTCQVSTNNKNILAALVNKSMSDTEVEVAFTVYDYDPKEKMYFKCFYTDNANLKGLIAKSGGELLIQMSMGASPEVPSPKNYAFSLGVMPQDLNMEIHMAVSMSNKFVKKWGVEAAR